MLQYTSPYEQLRFIVPGSIEPICPEHVTEHVNEHTCTAAPAWGSCCCCCFCTASCSSCSLVGFLRLPFCCCRAPSRPPCPTSTFPNWKSAWDSVLSSCFLGRLLLLGSCSSGFLQFAKLPVLLLSRLNCCLATLLAGLSSYQHGS